MEHRKGLGDSQGFVTHKVRHVSSRGASFRSKYLTIHEMPERRVGSDGASPDGPGRSPEGRPGNAFLEFFTQPNLIEKAISQPTFQVVVGTPNADNAFSFLFKVVCPLTGFLKFDPLRMQI